ncbi:hypothetical protein P154DRAFT_187110 [Amniculicola lignicola CBS 123094]|uniref:Uncharacterized protein n=1 Tax=Amniculicola lignicola CBS 123094 TaxID=1392246 RepID=A0A6A5WLL7_9PLEO|nr:hypothetical protein P154DRAFT_187110 [Amniculicola lignicola CBS 123094]
MHSRLWSVTPASSTPPLSPSGSESPSSHTLRPWSHEANALPPHRNKLLRRLPATFQRRFRHPSPAKAEARIDNEGHNGHQVSLCRADTNSDRLTFGTLDGEPASVSQRTPLHDVYWGSSLCSSTFLGRPVARRFWTWLLCFCKGTYPPVQSSQHVLLMEDMGRLCPKRGIDARIIQLKETTGTSQVRVQSKNKF